MDLSIIATLSLPIEIFFVLGVIGGPVSSMWLFNKGAWMDHGWLPVLIQCFSRVALDIALVTGIAGSAIGAVAMTLTFNASSLLCL